MFERVKSLFQAVKPKSVIRQIQARFDAAQTTHDNVKHWSAADHFSADQEARPEIRQDLPGLWLDGLVRGWQSQREEAPCKEITVYSYKYLIINALPTGLRVVMRFITRCAQGMRHKPPSQRRKHHDHEPEPAQRPSRIGAAYGKTTAAEADRHPGKAHQHRWQCLLDPGGGASRTPQGRLWRGLHQGFHGGSDPERLPASAGGHCRYGGNRMTGDNHE